MSAFFCELGTTGLLAARGPDAATFLHAQLTSDVQGLPPSRTQYSGYCSPKGRLLATFLLWRGDEEILLQLPQALCASIAARLAKYVLRAKLKIVDVSTEYRIFGVGGREAEKAVGAVAANLPMQAHAFVSSDRYRVARLPDGRFLVIAAAGQIEAARATLGARADARPESTWTRLDIEAGVPIITERTQDEYVPQMVNLDVLEAVSYTKGCYPGQEIVARTHYLGKLKQRMYRIHVAAGEEPLPGDALYSRAFGGGQASGAVLLSAPAETSGYDALAVIQTTAMATGTITWKAPDGLAVELLPLPYSIPM